MADAVWEVSEGRLAGLVLSINSLASPFSVSIGSVGYLEVTVMFYSKK